MQVFLSRFSIGGRIKLNFWGDAMGREIQILVIVAFVLFAAACSSGMNVPADDDMRASLSPTALTASTTGAEESDPEVRAFVLDKIRRQLLRDGMYPKSAIQEAELLSLTPAFTDMAPENSTWNYQAVARVNLKSSSIKIRYMIFDRNGELIVRKISV